MNDSPTPDFDEMGKVLPGALSNLDQYMAWLREKVRGGVQSAYKMAYTWNNQTPKEIRSLSDDELNLMANIASHAIYAQLLQIAQDQDDD